MIDESSVSNEYHLLDFLQQLNQEVFHLLLNPNDSPNALFVFVIHWAFSFNNGSSHFMVIRSIAVKLA